MVSTLAGLAGSLGSADGTNEQARFNRPSAVAVDYDGDLFVTDDYNRTIRKITHVGNRLGGEHESWADWSAGSDDGTNVEARFKGPQAVAMDAAAGFT